ncbi:MAG: dihydrofolate reductase, partial [Candidatus Cloacimonadota bacterium]|nr:dihydrofolate reductase [Candidatus Cloacimonadota bacterium]
MKKIIIAALTPEGKMGLDNKMPWHIPTELKLFKEITTGNTVIMGRKTYESIGENLSNRVNIVITSKKWESEKIIFAKNFRIALEEAY